MAESVEKQDNQKTIVAFVVGLLIGGLLVWAFSGPNDDAKKLETQEEAEETASTDDEASEEDMDDEDDMKLNVGEGNVVINDQPAGTSVAIESATYPVGEGWIGVQQYDDEKFGYVLGVVRFSESQGLIPKEIILQNPTVAGKKYAVVIYKENGDRKFGGDEKLPEVFTTFTAQ